MIKVKRLAFIGILLATLIPSVRVLALSDAQREVLDSGAEYFNVDEDVCGGSPQVVVQQAGAELPDGAKIYILGDSITNQSRTEIQTAMSEATFAVTSINADPGRAISVDTAGNDPTGLQAVTTDTSTIATSDAVIVALGTNSGTEDLNTQIPALITKIKEAKNDIQIFWTNLFYESGTGPDVRNAVITELSTSFGYKIINTQNEGIELSSDLVHPTTAGNKTFAETLVKGLRSGGSTPSTGGPAFGYDPLSLSYPTFPDEGALGRAITDYIREKRPSSPWLTVDANIGDWIIRESKSRNINPLLFTTIGKQENNFGSGTQTHVVNYYNYFGMKGETPIDIPGSEYRGFSSASEGMLFFMDKIKTNIQGPDRGLYKDVVNFYDYLGMHQAGQIKYPGEPLGNQGPTGQDGYDSAMRVYISWTTSDHPNNEYDGQIYNPGIYYRNSIGFINLLTGLSISDVPVRGGSGVIVNCASALTGGGGSGLIDPSGYSFPLAPQTKNVGGIEVGQTETRHHDNTAAFDLFSSDSASVFAIFGGTIDRLNTNYGDIVGCTSIQLKANDGFFYWYGHMKNPTVTEGQQVTAGQKIAEIADDQNFGSACWGGAPHLHIDRGCILDGVPQRAGRDECRDPDFIPFLAKLFEGLPD